MFNRTGSYVGAPWTEADNRDLQNALKEKRPPSEIALRLRRSKVEVKKRIEELQPVA
jgi:hypothetical protein